MLTALGVWAVTSSEAAPGEEALTVDPQRGAGQKALQATTALL